MKCIDLKVDIENFHPRPYSNGCLPVSVILFKTHIKLTKKVQCCLYCQWVLMPDTEK